MSESQENIVLMETEHFKKVDRHAPEIVDALANGPVYKKIGEVRATVAAGGEIVVTKLNDGFTETQNKAKPGDMIITNPGGERYILDASKFQKRYEQKLDEHGNAVSGLYTARGFCVAIDNPFNAPITMIASWGEYQNGESDAKIADSFDPVSGRSENEPYIIGKNEFSQTYELSKTSR